uniref:Uncharacterized protein n=1 Tax=viral metagenome TaxID=1070528 RepID=A0A6H1Z7K2_9ZZZZ
MTTLTYILLTCAGIAIVLCLVQGIGMIWNWWAMRRLNQDNQKLPFYVRRIR